MVRPLSATNASRSSRAREALLLFSAVVYLAIDKHGGNPIGSFTVSIGMHRATEQLFPQLYACLMSECA